MKKIIYSIFFYGISISSVFAAQAPKTPNINCKGLPGCNSGDKAPTESIIELVAQLIQYVAVFAVIALMLSGIMYLISGGEEEKVKKAKTWIMWSLVGVLLSISAWTIINLINNITINL